VKGTNWREQSGTRLRGMWEKTAASLACPASKRRGQEFFVPLRASHRLGRGREVTESEGESSMNYIRGPQGDIGPERRACAVVVQG